MHSAARLLFLVTLACLLGFRTFSASPVVISEFLAANTRGLADEDGDFEDWIEIRNVSGAAVNLADWALTDDATVPGKWTFPTQSLPAGQYLVVFASGKDRRTPEARLHTNFRLNNAGEYLALVPPGGEGVATEFAPQYPPQANDISFGTANDAQLRFFDPPTPGAANGTGFVNRVADTKFSVDRGFYDAPFDLVITCATDGAEIRYSTNGTPPTATTGLVANGPLRIDGTRVVRAAAFKAGWLPSDVDTHSYLFTADIIRQSPTGAPPPGWPSSWGSNTRDYGMDPDVVNNAAYRDTIQNDLKTLPSFCVTVHLPDLFDPSRGIYANPGQDGASWERPMSLELVFPDGRNGFQIDGGIRIRGGFSRSTDNPKHAFRFFFRTEYGRGKLQYPVFGEGAPDEFDGFDLRTFQNYSWSFQGDSRGTFMRDQFNRDAQLAMGSQAERGNYYHLYINGQYWGLYNTCERPEASYAATYFGGNKEDYDVIKVEAGPYTINATDGTMAGWTQIYNLIRSTKVDDVLYRRLLGQNPDGTRNPDYPVYIDPINLIDYMLVILYGGNLDAPISNFLGNSSPNNFFGSWNRVTRDRGFQFFVHDAEHTLLNVNEDRTGPFSAGDSSITKSNPQWIWQRLQASPEFRLLVGDRIQRHLQNGGVLTPTGARALYQRRKDEIDRAVVAESARWGDAKRGTPFTRNTDWVAAVNANLDFIARRTPILLSQLSADGLYPTVSAPQFNQQGGVVNSGFGLLMAPGGARLYFTRDGSDPRRPGGELSPSAIQYTGPIPLTESLTVKARQFGGGQWSALNEANFIIAQDFHELFITEVHYHPAPTADQDGDNFEFIELKNVGARQLDLSGVQFTNGVSFVFANGTKLAPGAFAVLVRDATAFASRYPDVKVAGTYTGRLSNSGERLTLVHATGAPLFSMAYDTRPPWPQLADGQGFSLVPTQPNLNAAPDSPANWRASSRIGGSPGADDPPADVLPVVVNELLTHTDPPLVDAVELYNPNTTAAAIGGWWLTDDRGTPKKFRIPLGRSIPAHGFVTFSELDFNRPTNAPSSFTFNSHGDEVWLFSADANGELTGFSDGFGFPASANGVTFGRHTNSVGEISYPTQATNSLDLPNVGPRIGPVVLNEIHFHPPAGDAEFVELRNISDTLVPLFDPLVPTNTWHLEGVGFVFPPGITLPPGGLLVVTAGDPVAFRSRFGIPAETPVLGPYGGVLQDDGETLSLERPDNPDPLPDGGTFVPYLVVDAVRYQNRVPWPVETATRGASLERRSPVGYADDPASWRASFGDPSPGFPNDGNRTPIADAGSDVEVEAAQFPLSVTLAGSASDDGLPVVPGRLTFTWTQLSGPGPAGFDGPSASNTVVRLPGTGVYVLRFTASDGERNRSDDVQVTVKRPSEQQTLVAAGAVWRYLDDGSDQGSAWRAPAFNDSTWASGPAQLGFGDGDEKTTLRDGVNGVRSATYYFRTKFTVADPRSINSLTLHLVRDDGAMVYLNGQLVFRANMPEGDITADTLASEVVGGADESAFFDQEVDPANLRAGDNVLAVEVHQQNLGSTDISFDLQLDALASAANRAPTANAGADRTARVSEPVSLAGTFTDDGLPVPPGVPTFRWESLTTPATGTVTFVGADTLAPTVTFPASGTYRLRLTVNDGALSATDEATITVGGDAYQDWKATHFSAAELQDPAISGDGADPDGDGMTNRAEFDAGTNPRDARSALRLRATLEATGRARLALAVVTGRSYTVLERDTIEGGTWRVLRQIDAATCDCDTDIALENTTTGERFYRAVTPRLP